MRNKVFGMITYVVALTMVFSLVACGSSSSKESDKKETETTSEPEMEKYADMEELAQTAEMQAMAEAWVSGGEDPETVLEVKGEGNKLIFSFCIADTDAGDAAQAQLESDLEGFKERYLIVFDDMFQDVANRLKDAVDVDNPVVVAEFVDQNGDVVVSKEITAEN